MPAWLTLCLFIAGCIVSVGLQAAATEGNWRTFWLAVKQMSLYLGGFAVLAGLAAIFAILTA